MFEYPTEDYTARTPAQDDYQEKRAHQQRLERDLAEAEKSAKRSPKKWDPIVARIGAVLEAAVADTAAADEVLEAERAARRAARAQVLSDALRWSLNEIGPVEFAAEDDPRMCLRIASPGAGHDILFQEESAYLSILWVKPGTYELDERLGYIYRPEERWSHVSGPTAIEPAQISLSSASKMTAADALEFASTVRAASLVAENLNKAFGL